MKANVEPCNFCLDEDNTEHWDSGSCGTDYCGSWHETRCKVCGWYTITCRCGCSNGQSKITEKRSIYEYGRAKWKL